MSFLHSSETPMSQHEMSRYVQTQEYASAPGQQQAATLAPLGYSDDSMRKRESIKATSHDYQEGDFVCPGFFRLISPDCFVFKFISQDWHYDMRREAQPILPFLYLGPLGCVRDREYLRKEGITLLLAIRDKRSAQARLVSGERTAAELGIEADFVDVTGHQELISMFPRAIRRINDHLASQDHGKLPSHIPKKVLVFCESGNDRSAAVVITYMMAMFSLKAEKAMKAVQSQRFCVTLDEGWRQLFSSFETILEAKRDVEHVRRANSSRSHSSSKVSKKRNLEDSHVEEVKEGSVMDTDGNEYEDWEARKPVAPFQDRA